MTSHGTPAPDVVVVGAGGSGAVVAARLAERGRRVLLLDAGWMPAVDGGRDPGAGLPAALQDARRVPGSDPASAGVRSYRALLTADRPWDVVRGRGFGGSTTVNGGYFIRPRPEDLAEWARAGGPEWEPTTALTRLRRMESDLDEGAGPLHGDHGPIPVTRPGADDPATTAFIAAARAAGAEEEPDKNAWTPSGVGPVPTNTRGGVRWNTGTAYLQPLLRAGGTTAGGGVIELRGGAPVEAVVVRDGRAVGVHVGGETVSAGETVLAAGAFDTPRLLMASGLDRRSAATFADHPQIVVSWRPRARAAAPRAATTWLGAALHLDIDGATVEILQALAPLATLSGGSGHGEPHALLVSSLDPGAASGRIPPGDAPIEFGYLGTARERALLRAGVRAAAELIRSPELHGEPVDLDPDTIADDRRLDAWIRSRLGTSAHTCASAAMGEVVDGAGRVRDIRGLRIADTSILPSAPRRGPAVSAVLVGETIADAMTTDGH